MGPRVICLYDVQMEVMSVISLAPQPNCSAVLQTVRWNLVPNTDSLRQKTTASP